MPLYFYRTYPPLEAGVDSWEFAYEQEINDNLLVVDPKSGYPVKRVNRACEVYLPPLKNSHDNSKLPDS